MTCNYTRVIAWTVPCHKYKKASSFLLDKPVLCDFPRNPNQQQLSLLSKMFKFTMVALMTIFAMIALSFAHPSSYGYNAQKGNDAKGYEYSAQPAPVYGSGYDKKIYGEYEGHPGHYKETKGY